MNQVSFLVTGWIFLTAIISVLIGLFGIIWPKTIGRLDNLEKRMDGVENELREIKQILKTLKS